MREGTINITDCGNCKHWIPWTDEDWQKYCYSHYTAFGWDIPSKRYDFGWCDKVKAGTMFGDGNKYKFDGYAFADENYNEDLGCFEPKEEE